MGALPPILLNIRSGWLIMGIYGIDEKQVHGLIKGIMSGDVSDFSERELNLFHESFSEQLKANVKDEDIPYGKWLSGVKSDFDFRKKVLNEAIAGWDSRLNGTNISDVSVGIYDDFIDNAFGDNGRPSTTTAEQRESFMSNYIKHIKAPFDYDNNALDTNYALYETRHFFSDERFFESEFGNKEDYMRMLTYRKVDEISAIHDMRDNIYTKESVHDAHRTVNKHEGFLDNAFSYSDSKLKALLVFYELEGTELTADDRGLLSNQQAIHDKYPSLVESIHDYREAVREETSVVDAQFTIDSYEMVSDAGIDKFKDQAIEVVDWNSYIPKLGQELSVDGPLFSDPLPDETSAVTTEMLVGNVVNESAEILQEKHDAFRKVWSVRDFVNYKDQAQELFGRDLDPDELVDNLLPTNLTAYEVLGATMAYKILADADVIHNAVEMIDGYADQYYLDNQASEIESLILNGKKEDIVGIYGQAVWDSSKLSENFVEPVYHDLPEDSFEQERYEDVVEDDGPEF